MNDVSEGCKAFRRPRLFTSRTALQAMVFLAAGGLSFAVDVAVLTSLLAAGFSRTGSNALATVSAVAVNFLVNRWNFRGRAPRGGTVLGDSSRFLALAVGSGVFTFFGFELAATLFRLDDTIDLLVARVVVVSIGTLVRYLLMRNWVFR